MRQLATAACGCIGRQSIGAPAGAESQTTEPSPEESRHPRKIHRLAPAYAKSYSRGPTTPALPTAYAVLKNE